MASDETVHDEARVENVAIVVDAALGELATGREVDPHRESVLVYLASLHTVPGRRTAISALRRIARIMGVDPSGVDGNCWQRVHWCKLGARETTFIQMKLEESGAAPNTTKLTMTILRQVHWHAFRLGHMSGDAYARAKTTKVSGERAPRGRALKDEEIEAVSKVIGQRASPLREMSAAAWGIGIACGLRREEFVWLKTSSVREGGKVLRVMGKGRKEQDQKLAPWARGPVWSWLNIRGKLGLSTDALFPRWRDGAVQDEPASVDSMWRFLKGLQDGSGVEAFSPHDMRRTFCTWLLRKQDVKVVQGLMRHRDPATTLGYDRREKDEMSALQDEALDQLGARWSGGLKAASAGPKSLADHLDPELLFYKGTQAVTLGWVRKQARLLESRGLSIEKVVEALVKVGLTKDGRAIELGDL